MADGENRIAEFIATLARSALGIKVGPGVLGIVTPVNIVGLIAIAVFSYSLSAHPVYALCAAGLVIAYLVYANERAFRYAEKNPIPALLGGSELLQLFRDQASAKDKSIVVDQVARVESGKSITDGGSAP